MKIFLTLICFISFDAFATSDYIVDCQPEKDQNIAFTFVLDKKNNIAEILHLDYSEPGLLETKEHFYTLFFRRNAQNINSSKIEVVINRVQKTFSYKEIKTNLQSSSKEPSIYYQGDCSISKYAQRL